MLSIGEFAKVTNLTIRALRYYEQKSILLPKRVDEDTGYRFYTTEQVDDARVIIILKQVGFSIRDIQDIFENKADSYYLLEQLQMRRVRAIEEVNEARFKLNLIVGILMSYDSRGNYQDNLLEVLKMDLLDIDLKQYQKSFFEMANEMTREANVNNIAMSGIVIDIDSFKRINDDYGHDVGDVVLKEIKDVITGLPQDKFGEYVVERFGGDEFRILLKGDLDQAVILAEEIRGKVENIDYSLYVDGLVTTATIGVALLAKDKGAANLFANATSAMYNGKANGGNNITVSK